MADTIDTIQKIQVGGEIYSIDAQKLDGQEASTFQLVENLVTTVNSTSTDDQYPSAKYIYDTLVDIETKLAAI